MRRSLSLESRASLLGVSRGKGARGLWENVGLTFRDRRGSFESESSPLKNQETLQEGKSASILIFCETSKKGARLLERGESYSEGRRSPGKNF